MRKRTHYDTASTDHVEKQYADDHAPKSRRKIPAHVFREWSIKAAKAGAPSATCYDCGDKLTMDFIRMCRVGRFQNEFVCRDCQKANGYKTV